MRYKITIEYDGTHTLGWQRQLDGPSIQEYLENALSLLMPENKKAEEASTGLAPQVPATTLQELRRKSGFGVEDEDADTERKTAAYIDVREDLNTGSAPQVSATTLQEPRRKSGFGVEDEDADTERKTAAYIDVREDLSTGSAPQVPATTRLTPEVQGAGRTDAGVHALGQVAHFDLERDIEDWKLREAINFHLREQDAPVVVLNVERVSQDFNARFSAVGRGYIYRILNRRTPPVLEKDRVWWVPVPLDTDKMRQGAQYLLGHHDFSSFRAAACQAKSPLKTLDKLEIICNGDEIIFEVEARSFLHHQVRNMVGTLKLVGDGHLRPEDIRTVLEAKDRKAAGPTAPACGLYLSKVMY